MLNKELLLTPSQKSNSNPFMEGQNIRINAALSIQIPSDAKFRRISWMDDGIEFREYGPGDNEIVRSGLYTPATGAIQLAQYYFNVEWSLDTYVIGVALIQPNEGVSSWDTTITVSGNFEYICDFVRFPYSEALGAYMEVIGITGLAKTTKAPDIDPQWVTLQYTTSDI